MTLQKFENDERGYAAYLRLGLSYVCNAMEAGPEFRRIHRSDCWSLNLTKTGIRTSYSKLCSDHLRELVREVTSRVGPEGEGFRFCHFCRQADRI
jgi:hypothetical protein